MNAYSENNLKQCPYCADSLIMSAFDFYHLLGISPQATSEEIHRAYRMLAVKYHPDTGADPSGGVFRLICQAFETLSDPQKRSAYDQRYYHIHARESASR